MGMFSEPKSLLPTITNQNSGAKVQLSPQNPHDDARKSDKNVSSGDIKYDVDCSAIFLTNFFDLYG